jgi:nucleotide-binding universal stress UspA family protein
MSYVSLLAHMDLGATNEGVLRLAGDLAKVFGASVIGVAACQPMQVYAGDAYSSGEAIEQDRIETEQLIKVAEQQFRSAMQGRAHDIRWRSIIAFASLADYLSEESRGVDLVVIAPDGEDMEFDRARRVRTSDLTMSLGRPVLLAPASVKSLNLDQVVVGWKDSRESRRAASSALPLLKKAGCVSVVQVAKEEDLSDARQHVAEVADWLQRHKVRAEPFALTAGGDDATQLAAFVQERKAGLLVAGAYGHSRLREWAFGGVTRDLLLRSPCATLLSH